MIIFKYPHRSFKKQHGALYVSMKCTYFDSEKSWLSLGQFLNDMRKEGGAGLGGSSAPLISLCDCS